MKRIFSTLSAALLIGLLAGCGHHSAPQPQQLTYTQPQQQAPGLQTYQPQQQMATYRLGSGDELRLTVFGEDSMTGNYKVDGTGMISLPLIGNVMAGNLTVPELQASIAAHLSQGFLVNPRVSVQVMNYRPFFILGEVNRPNQYPYVEGMKVINAVAMAGGFTYRADEQSMTIVHNNDPARTKQPAGPDTYVLPGDSVEVEERLF